MKLNAELSGIAHSLSIRIDGPHVSAEVDGRSYELEVRERDGLGYLILHGTKVYDCRVEPTGELTTVHLRQNSYPIRVVDPKRLRSAQSGGRHDHGSAEIVAPMPGKIIRVLVRTGEEVVAGNGILIVEAMKMQNELKAPKGGTVVAIHAEAGATVNAGDVLAVIE